MSGILPWPHVTRTGAGFATACPHCGLLLGSAARAVLATGLRLHLTYDHDDCSFCLALAERLRNDGDVVGRTHIELTPEVAE